MPLLVRGRVENELPGRETSSGRTDIRLELRGGGTGGGEEAPKETPTGDLGGRTGGVKMEDLARLALEARPSEGSRSFSGSAVATPTASEEKLAKCMGLAEARCEAPSMGD